MDHETAFELVLSSLANPPNDSFRRLSRMNWIPAIKLVNPDHDQPSACRRSPDDLVRPATSEVGLDAPYVVEHFVDFVHGDMPLGMILLEMPSICGIPHDRPIVHPASIYVMDGQGGGRRPGSCPRARIKVSPAARRTGFVEELTLSASRGCPRVLRRSSCWGRVPDRGRYCPAS